MADIESIEQDLREFLEKEDNMRKADRLTYLMLIMKKHFELDKIDHMITYHDLSEIFDDSKRRYAGTTTPMRITKKDLYPTEVPLVLLMESFIGYLNRNKILKRLVKFDHRR